MVGLRVVVTGGAGFLGVGLVGALLARGDRVVCVDNLSTGRLENAQRFLGNDKFSFVRHDITEPLDIAGPVDAVVNLASPASPPDYHRMPLETLLVGSRGTENALRLAQAKGARFVQASTSEVYGDPAVHPQPEDYFGNVNPVGPRSVYDEAKRYGEALCAAFRQSQNVDVGIVRIFNTYGPAMRANDGRVVSSFVTMALEGQPLTIYGDGSQTRSFCFVDDLVLGLLAMVDSHRFGPVNLGNPGECTVSELARMIQGLAGSSAPLRYYALPTDDPVRRKPDISRARELLDWEPQIDLEEGLRRTIAWFAARPAETAAAALALQNPRKQWPDAAEGHVPALPPR